MRLVLNQVNAQLIYELELADAIRRITHNGFDIVQAELPTGQRISIHLIERDIDVGYIKDILEQNAARDTYTLIMLWAAMLLPEHGETYFPYDWMSALLSLYGDQIYAFEAEGPDAWLFPVHFDILPGTVKRSIRYGDKLDMSRLTCEYIVTESSFLNGRWRIADFGGNAAARHQKASAGDSERQSEQEARRVAGHRSSIHVYYDILGVDLDADWDTVRKAYHQLAMLYHPDLNKSAEANAKMQQVNAAYAHIADFLGASGRQ